MLWLSARLTLALRRTRRFVRWWLAIGGTAAVLALLLPVAMGDGQAALQLALEQAASDTLRTAAAVNRATLRVATADSTLVAALAERVRLNFWGIDIGIGTGDSFLFFEATAAMSITQAYSTQEEHDRLFPVLLEPIHQALSAAVGSPASWDCWAKPSGHGKQGLDREKAQH